MTIPEKNRRDLNLNADNASQISSYTTRSPAEKLLGRLEGVRRTGPRRWMARCCSHEDRTASLSIRETDDGWVLLMCFSGCSVDEIVAAVGLTTADLFPQKLTLSRGKGRRFDIPRFDWTEFRGATRSTIQGVALLTKDIADGYTPTEADLAFLSGESSRLLEMLDLGEAQR